MNDFYIIEQYKNGKTLKEIADVYATSHFTIKKILLKNGIQIRTKGAQSGNVSWNKGVKFTNQVISHNENLIISGEYKNLTEPAARGHIKKWLIRHQGHKCEICGNTTWNNQPIPLICDHKDGDYTNMELDNFRLVCCNCDAQLPTFKSKNRGKGRTYDREYRRRRARVD